MATKKRSTSVREISRKIVLAAILFQACLSYTPVGARFVDGHYIIDEDDIMTKRSGDFVDREKRYTDSQENASAYCTGMCMFEERRPYSYCFDLCNWNGRAPNPWDAHRTIKFEESKKGQAIRENEFNLKDGLRDMQRTATRMRPLVNNNFRLKGTRAYNQTPN